MTSLVAQVVMNLPAMQETRVWSLSQEDSLEKRMAIYSSIFAWRIPWTGEPGGLQSMGLQRVGHNWAINTDTLIDMLSVVDFAELNNCNGTPLQYSCLENPMDRGPGGL